MKVREKPWISTDILGCLLIADRYTSALVSEPGFLQMMGSIRPKNGVYRAKNMAKNNVVFIFLVFYYNYVGFSGFNHSKIAN